MVNFNNVEIVRAIMHQVSAKHGERTAEVTASDHLLNLDEDSKKIVRDRLSAAFARQSKAFELEIEKDGADSCFADIKSLRQTDNDNNRFIELSVAIAQALADSQRQSRIPGGFLLVVHCKYDNKPLYVLIKAEPHEALGVTEMSVQSIKNIILSPEQKLYKAVYFEQKNAAAPGAELAKSDYRVVLFDSNVNSNNTIAQYFYQDFLGLSISGNSQLQTALFYQKMNESIWSELRGLEAVDASDSLRVMVMNNDSVTINPHDVITTVIPLEHRDVFLDKIVEEFPQSFTRDTSLIDTRLEKKTITLSDNVKITAPSLFFAENVTVEEQEGEYVVKIRRNNGNA